MMKLKRVEVFWRDSKADGGWTSRAQAERTVPSFCRTVGYIVKRTVKKLVLAQNVSDTTENVGEFMSIPAECVKKVRRLR